MVQRSAKEEDSLLSQRLEYERVLAQQRRLYEEKMSELKQLHTQRKVGSGGRREEGVGMRGRKGEGGRREEG